MVVYGFFEGVTRGKKLAKYQDIFLREVQFCIQTKNFMITDFRDFFSKS